MYTLKDHALGNVPRDDVDQEDLSWVNELPQTGSIDFVSQIDLEIDKCNHELAELCALHDRIKAYDSTETPEVQAMRSEMLRSFISDFDAEAYAESNFLEKILKKIMLAVKKLIRKTMKLFSAKNQNLKKISAAVKKINKSSFDPATYVKPSKIESTPRIDVQLTYYDRGALYFLRGDLIEMQCTGAFKLKETLNLFAKEPFPAPGEFFAFHTFMPFHDCFREVRPVLVNDVNNETAFSVDFMSSSKTFLNEKIEDDKYSFVSEISNHVPEREFVIFPQEASTMKSISENLEKAVKSLMDIDLDDLYSDIEETAVGFVDGNGDDSTELGVKVRAKLEAIRVIHAHQYEFVLATYDFVKKTLEASAKEGK